MDILASCVYSYTDHSDAVVRRTIVCNCSSFVRDETRKGAVSVWIIRTHSFLNLDIQSGMPSLTTLALVQMIGWIFPLLSGFLPQVNFLTRLKLSAPGSLQSAHSLSSQLGSDGKLLQLLSKVWAVSPAPEARAWACTLIQLLVRPA